MAKKGTKTNENALDVMVAGLKQRFGEDAVMMLDDKPAVDVDAISTRSLGLDWALGIGGLPRGRVIEIYGPEATGKTTLALHVVAEAQSKGDACAYIDVEHALDPAYAGKIGVDTKKLLICQPNGGEEAMQIVDEMIKSKQVGVIVVDSVSALIPKSEIDGDIGQQHMAGQARLMSQSLRMLVGSISKSNTMLIFINQLRTNIGAYAPGGMVPETTSGGRALKYAASVRIDLRRIASVKKGEDVVGARIKAKVVKNKVASPFKVTEYDVMYGEGISKEGELLALGESLGIVKRSGSTYTTGVVVLGRGYEASRTFLRENLETAEAIRREIKQKHEA